MSEKKSLPEKLSHGASHQDLPCRTWRAHPCWGKFSKVSALPNALSKVAIDRVSALPNADRWKKPKDRLF